MIQIKDLSVILENKQILSKINVDFQPGINIIIGENGSGKSTLLKTIEKLIEHQEGTITIDNKNLDEIPRIKRSQTMSYLPQVRPIPMIDGYLLIEHGRFPYNSLKNKNEEDAKAINEAIEITKTQDIVDKKLTSLSGGERQKIYIAAMLAQTTPIMLLDEPTTYLDLTNQIEILDMLKTMKEKTIVIVLHDLIQAFSYADNIVVIHKGNNYLQGKPEDIYKSEKIKEVFNCTIKPETDAQALYKYKIIK